MLLRGLRWGLAGALVAWTVVRLLGLERGWPLVPVFAFTPWVAALALVTSLLGAVLRWRLFTLVTGACALVLAVAIAPRVVPNRAPDDAEGARLRVLSANVAGEPGTASSIRALIRRFRPDVLSILELPPEVVQAYAAAGIDELLPHQVLEPRPGFSGTGLYSRLPLRVAPRPVGTLFAMAAASAAPTGAAAIEVFAVHARAPTSARQTRQWRADLRALPPTGDGGLRILAGDFNATLDHHELRRVIGRGYRDAAEQAGGGLRMSWPTGRAVLPATVAIDHVLADRRIRVASARTVPIAGSDHNAVFAELVLPDADRGGG
jgi:endonuclease/exonuclease/phosphatase (EEP) superfamily protein YafD